MDAQAVDIHAAPDSVSSVVGLLASSATRMEIGHRRSGRVAKCSSKHAVVAVHQHKTATVRKARQVPAEVEATRNPDG